MTRVQSTTAFWILILTVSIIIPAASAATLPTGTSDAPDLEPRDLVVPSNIPEGHNDNDTILCVFPISGQYGFLPRLLYYVSLVFAIVGRYQRWLVMGALASALSYAGTTAIHAMALTKSRKPIFDLDILAVWAILSTGCLAFAALVHWSSSIHKSSAKHVLLLWGLLVAIGLLIGRGLLMDTHSDAEPACRSASGELLTSESQLIGSHFNCTYECFGMKRPMRGPSDMVAIPTENLLTSYANMGVLLLPVILTAAHKLLTLNVAEHTPSYTCTSVVMLYLNSSLNARLAQHVYNAACTSWYGGYFIMFQHLHRAKFKNNRKGYIVCSFLYAWVVFELVFDVCTPVFFVANIIFNELNLNKTNLPNSEEIEAVDQWSPVVAAILVVIASLINKATELFVERKRAKKKAAGDTPESPSWPGQHSKLSCSQGLEIHTVTPKLDRQGTFNSVCSTTVASSSKSGQ